MENYEKIYENAENKKKQDDFYQKLRKKVQKYVDEHPGSKYIEYVAMAPDLFHLLCKLLGDTRVPAKNKLYIGAAITYFISPIDIALDVIPVVGITDDVALASWVLKSLLESVDKSVLIEHWAGEEDVLNVIEQMLVLVDEYAGKGLMKKIFKFIKKDED